MAIENTTSRDPLVHLLGAMSDDPGAYITGMEADGQRQLVHSDVLPANCDEEALKAAGVTLGPAVAGDPRFRQATLPTGWRKQPSDHSMWSHVVDQRGRRRIQLFYKAAFYDRDAFGSVVDVAGYVCDVDAGNSPLVFDEWVTREAFVAQAQESARNAEETAVGYEQHGMVDAAGRKRATAEKLRAVARKAAGAVAA